MYADECAAGNRDDFRLSFGKSGNKLCGSYELTAQLGNHVDDGDLTDWVIDKNSDGTYQFHFHVSGTVGEAHIHISGDKLYWNTLSKHAHAEDEPISWNFEPPDSAVLIRDKTNATPTVCDGPQDK